jgi:SAM-dependent methyltransferase
MSTPPPSNPYRRGGANARRLFGSEPRKAARYYRAYVRFVMEHAPAGGRILDLGCGGGWSSALLAQKGSQVVGLDVDPGGFEPPRTERLQFAAASALAIPFPDACFDVVTSYQMLEHINDPATALNEMARVTRPGGVLIVAGPNLLSPLNSLRQIAVGCWRNRPVRAILFRRPEDPRLPFGHTLPEALVAMVRNAGLLAAKSTFAGGQFTHREPDMRPPSRGDKDACTLLNPLDVAAFLRRRGWQILSLAPGGRPQWSSALAGGTWVAARKTSGKQRRA